MMNLNAPFIPGLELIQLTPDEEDDCPTNCLDDQEDCTTWLDDSECQENLFQIIPLTPEETIVDENNHIQPRIKLFFEELGYLTEEPEPIDPTRDYEEEARQMLEERNRTRQKHINISRMPSLSPSRSGVSSSSSSICHHEHDVRSPHYMGGGNADPFYPRQPSPPHYVPYLHASYHDKLLQQQHQHSQQQPHHHHHHHHLHHHHHQPPHPAYHLNRIRHS